MLTIEEYIQSFGHTLSVKDFQWLTQHEEYHKIIYDLLLNDDNEDIN